jgi:uncharacterized protein YfiM (DUF2279 family)
VIFHSSTPLFAGEISPALKAYLNSFKKGDVDKKKDQWFAPDKGYHAMGSLISTMLVGQISINRFENSLETSKVIGAGTTFALGFAKELYDSSKPQNHFSWKDLTANGVGIIIGVILLGVK